MKKVRCVYCGKILYTLIDIVDDEGLILKDTEGNIRTFKEELNLNFCSMDCLNKYDEEKK